MLSPTLIDLHGVSRCDWESWFAIEGICLCWCLPGPECVPSCVGARRSWFVACKLYPPFTPGVAFVPRPSSTIILIDPHLLRAAPNPDNLGSGFSLPEQSISLPQRDLLGRPQVTSSVSVIHHYYSSYWLKYEHPYVSLTATLNPLCDISWFRRYGSPPTPHKRLGLSVRMGDIATDISTHWGCVSQTVETTQKYSPRQVSPPVRFQLVETRDDTDSLTFNRSLNLDPSCWIICRFPANKWAQGNTEMCPNHEIHVQKSTTSFRISLSEKASFPQKSRNPLKELPVSSQKINRWHNLM